MTVPEALSPQDDVSTCAVPLQPDSFKDIFMLTPRSRLISDAVESRQCQNFALDHHDLLSFPSQLNQDLDSAFLVPPIMEENHTFSLAAEEVASTAHIDTADLESILADDAHRGDFVPNVSET